MKIMSKRNQIVKSVLQGNTLENTKSKIMSEKKCLEDELKVSVSKKRPKFKAGTDLATSVNSLHVDSSKEETEDSEIIKISLHMVSKSCVEVCD